MTAPKTYDILARTALQEDPGTCFALLGDANMNWATRLAEGGCRMVYVRHEHCAVSAAMSHARATGGVGLATVTCGPGLTQTVTALAAVARARIPLVVFAGEAPLGSAWYNQAIDQAPFVVACGAAYVPLHHTARAPTALRDAFLQARTERRPVVVGVPFDLQAQGWTGSDALPTPSHALIPALSPMPPHPDDVARAADLITGSERIIVLCGRGALHAAPAARALAAACGGLLATSLPARGLFHDDPYSLGVAGGFASDIARECFAAADLVIAIGARLSHHMADGGKLHPQARVLHIDTDPAALSQGRIAADSHLRADALLGAEALTTALPPRTTPWRSAALARRIHEMPADATDFPDLHGKLDPRAVIAALDATLPKDWEMVNSSGHCSYFAAHMQGRPAQYFHTIREFGAIGNGLAYAIGVAAARPDTPVVLIDGDGSLLMHVQELETIRRHNLNILICVLNDGAYGSEIHKLRAEGLSDAGAVFGWPDLARMSRGFDLQGEHVSDLAALADLPALTQAFIAARSPTLWDFHISDLVTSPVIRRAHPAPH